MIPHPATSPRHTSPKRIWGSCPRPPDNTGSCALSFIPHHRRASPSPVCHLCDCLDPESPDEPYFQEGAALNLEIRHLASLPTCQPKSERKSRVILPLSLLSGDSSIRNSKELRRASKGSSEAACPNDWLCRCLLGLAIFHHVNARRDALKLLHVHSHALTFTFSVSIFWHWASQSLDTSSSPVSPSPAFW